MIQTKNVDVVISGAGPVGLFLAYDLSKKGHSVAIVDPKPGPTDQSRAILVTSRTMEILDGKGLASDVLKEAFISSGMRMIRNGSVFGQLDACGDTAFPYMTILMQGKTEEIINNKLENETDCRVEWETRLESFTQDAESVTATVKNIKSNDEYTIRASYIIGADGSHSAVRKCTPGWTFEGVAIRTKFILADLTLTGDDIETFSHRMNAFNLGNKVMGMIRIRPLVHKDDDSHVFRLFGNLESYTKNEADQNRSTHGIVNKADEVAPDLQAVQEYIDTMTAPLKFQASDLIWSSYFRINERIANGYRRDRAFLAGDAAHCHSPAGGQGMNLGIQDADNLSWKISAVLKGQVADSEGLLNSYETERIPHAKETIKTTSVATETGLKEGYLMNITRQCIMSAVLSIPQMREYAFKTVMQLSLSISPNDSKILGTSDKGLIKTGTFFPDTVPLRKRFIPSGESLIERRSLRSYLLNNHQCILLFVNTCHPANIPNEGIVKTFWNRSKSYPVRRLVIQSPWHTHTTAPPEYVTRDESEDMENGFYVEERLEDPISVTSRVGLLPLLSKYFGSSQEPSVLVMIRPDFYVTHARVVYNDADLESAYEYIDTVFK